MVKLKKKAGVAKRARRQHTGAFKAQVALAALREDKTMAQLSQEFDLHANQITDWKRQLLERAADVFGGADPPKPVDLQPLHAKIGCQADLALMRQIDQLHLEHPFMGQRMLVRQLKRQGVLVGRLHVRTLMQRMGICAMAPQPGTSRPAPGHKIYPYLLRHVRVTQANHVWALDTTYIPMERGFVYLTAVVDVASRRVLAHKVATTLEACHAAEVISQALGRSVWRIKRQTRPTVPVCQNR